MKDRVQIIRSLVTFGACAVVALFLGVELSKGFTRESVVSVSLALFVLMLPLLIRWYHMLLVLSLNLNIVAFFLPGRPSIWMIMAIFGGVLVLCQRILKPEVRSIRVPSLTWPLLCMAAVILVTAQLTGGIGFSALGSEAMGGKRYLMLILSVVVYFLITAEPVPAQRIHLYVGLYFLANLTSMVGDFAALVPSWGRYVLLPFPVYHLNPEVIVGRSRLTGVSAAAFGVFCFMMARYGIRGMFLSGKRWRAVALVVTVFIGTLGGFRSTLIAFILIFGVQLYLEGLHRTRAAPIILIIAALVGVGCIGFARHLPYTVQRSLSFLPLDIDPAVRRDAQGSSEWRLRMWREVLPQVPSRLLLGQGLGIRSSDYTTALTFTYQGHASSAHETLEMAGDYHNGPLSLVMPFGIWGVMAFVWFCWASFKALYANFRYGDPSLNTVNALLLAWFLTHMFMFWVVAGGFYGDMIRYAAIVGLSVSINHGVRRPAVDRSAEHVKGPVGPLARPRVLPSFSRFLR